MKTIVIDPLSGIPKYKQIINSVEIAIAEKRIQKGDQLPSVNKICMEHGISRDTVLLAYDELKKRGILFAIPGKGYYLKSTEFSFEQRFFVLFDEFNAFKEDLYVSFMEAIDNQAQIDIYFHHFNEVLFRKLINESNGLYSKYIIMSTHLKGAAEAIQVLPENDVYILDQTREEFKKYPAIFQNFEEDIFQSLQEALGLLKKFKKLVLIYPGFKEPYGMVVGFEQFAREFSFPSEVITDFQQGQDIEKGTVYLIPNDRHLVQVLEQANSQHLTIAQDFGIISYNDTPLKKVVANGITTISTDFQFMGKCLADMVLHNKKLSIQNPCRLLIRNSI